MITNSIINDDFRNITLENPVDLFIVDPPYGNIVSDEYDKIDTESLNKFLLDTAKWMGKYAYSGSSAYIFGGVGKYQDRPFFEFIIDLEIFTHWRIVNFITWAKRRGYGTQKNWMFAREELLFLVYDATYPKYFNVPYRDEERSEAWKKRLNKKSVKYKPKTNNLRYSNVIQDINEIFANQNNPKLVSAQKPERLYELLIETSCPPDGYVVDPMCGSGTTGYVLNNMPGNRKYTLIEKDEKVYNIAKKRVTIE